MCYTKGKAYQETVGGKLPNNPITFDRRGGAKLFSPPKAHKAGEGVRQMVTYSELLALLALIVALVDVFLKIYYNKKR